LYKEKPSSIGIKIHIKDGAPPTQLPLQARNARSNPMTILAVLFSEGGLGDVGRQVVQQALKIPGMNVRAIAPSPEMLTQPIEAVTQLEGLGNHERLQTVKWDPSMPRETLSAAIAGTDAVINCYGNRQMEYRHNAGPTAENVVACMQASNVRPWLVAPFG
jgi:putative NADH-flavin reductase